MNIRYEKQSYPPGSTWIVVRDLDENRVIGTILRLSDGDHESRAFSLVCRLNAEIKPGHHHFKFYDKSKEYY